MFDIGFTELLLVGLVAPMVLGPERLPGAVRTTGLWVGRLKRSFSNIKAEVEREIGADEIREAQLEFYRQRPALVAHGLARHAERIANLGLLP